MKAEAILEPCELSVDNSHWFLWIETKASFSPVVLILREAAEWAVRQEGQAKKGQAMEASVHLIERKHFQCFHHNNWADV